MTRRLVLFTFGTFALLLLVGVASNAEQFSRGAVREAENRAVLPIERDLGETTEETQKVEEPLELPEPVAIGLAIALGIGGLYLLSRQRISLRFRRPSMSIARGPAAVITEEDEAEAIADFARDLIDELNDGDSPRYAIQRAYAAVETGFGAQELARKPAETPLRYLDRIFGRHSAVKEPLATLTDLFQHARFSDDAVTEPMRSQAIDALTDIRDYYQAFAWKKISRREKARSERARA